MFSPTLRKHICYRLVAGTVVVKVLGGWRRLRLCPTARICWATAMTTMTMTVTMTTTETTTTSPNTAGTIKLQYQAANNAAGVGGDNDKDNNEGVPRKTLVTATIRRKTYAANADISEGGASNGPTTKVRQYSSLNLKAPALPRSGCS